MWLMVMRHLLCSSIETENVTILFQALKDLDYDVREKTFVESLLDIEFTEIFDKGILYAGWALLHFHTCRMFSLRWMLTLSVFLCCRYWSLFWHCSLLWKWIYIGNIWHFSVLLHWDAFPWLPVSCCCHRILCKGLYGNTSRSTLSLAGMVTFLPSITVYSSWNSEDRGTLTLRN